jgi:hypothetical protein
MPILYESVYRPVTLRPKVVNKSAHALQQPSSAPYWEVSQTYKVGSIYMAGDQLRNLIIQNVQKGFAQQNLKVYSLTIVNEWAVWQGFWTDYYCQYDAIVGSASTSSMAQPKDFFPWVALAIVIIALSVVAGLIVIFYILKTGTDAINALFSWIPPQLKGTVSTILLVGLGVAAIG